MLNNQRLVPVFYDIAGPLFPGAFVAIKGNEDADFFKYASVCAESGYFVAGAIKVGELSYVGTLMVVDNMETAFIEGKLRGRAEERVRFIEGEMRNGFMFVLPSPAPYTECSIDDIKPTITVVNAFLDKLKTVVGTDSPFAKEDFVDVNNINNWIDGFVPLLSRCDKSKIFVEDDTLTRLRLTAVGIQMQLDYETAKKDFEEKVNQSIQESQRDYFLREQLRVCNEELYGAESEIEDYEKKIRAVKAPKVVKDKLMKELRKLANTQSSSPESYVQRNYLDSVLDLPWGKRSKENVSIDRAREILDEDHYGIEKVKERIIEFLAVKKLAPDKKGNILCFIGPPGVGKTSIVRSIAKAMGREYYRASLGGVHDEAEIRGHRKTYIGSMAGRIMSGITKVGTMNPVFLLDEIDKVGQDFKGDPSSALLEVLDPEQNKGFVDNFLEIPFDLSDVLFITTANSAQTIAAPLLDRMEIIEMSGYTIEEKTEIAMRHLIPKQAEAHGVKELVNIAPDAIKAVIDGYTREAGVRKLEQQLAALIRKVAVKLASENKNERKLINVSADEIEGYLGIPKYRGDELRKSASVGAITGLAWTEYGGVTLELECRLIEGKGDVIITGNLGKVMEESAKLAVSVVKSLAEEYHVDKELFKKYDVHIHAPEGAVPKDGPSAGIALTTVILSAFAQRKVTAEKALTGEITLWGRVLPIGGVKEKCLGALQAGITTVLLPVANKKDYAELPETIKSKVKVTFVENIEQVLKEMLL